MATEVETLENLHDEDIAVLTGDGLRPLSKERPDSHNNFEGSGLARWAWVSKATGPDAKPGKEILNQIFHLKYYLMHEVVMGAASGNPKRVVQTILLDQSKNAYKFSSQGVEDSLRAMIQNLDPEDWANPIPIVVRRSTTSAGRGFYSITPADEDYVENE